MLWRSIGCVFPPRNRSHFIVLRVSDFTGQVKSYQSGCGGVKQLDDGIDDTLVSLDTTSERYERGK